MKKVTSVFFVVIILCTVVFTISSSAATCVTRSKTFNGAEYDYSATPISCAEPACVSKLLCSLKSTNKATSRFSSVSGYTKSAYVKLTEADGSSVAKDSGNTTNAVATAIKDPVFFTPVAVVHRGTCPIADLCPGDHYYYTYD